MLARFLFFILCGPDVTSRRLPEARLCVRAGEPGGYGLPFQRIRAKAAGIEALFLEFPLPMTPPDRLQLITSDGFADYALLDCGAGRKLERFGAVVVDRPEPQ